MFSNHSEIKLEINKRKISGSTPWVKEEITREIRKYFELNAKSNMLTFYKVHLVWISVICLQVLRQCATEAILLKHRGKDTMPSAVFKMKRMWVMSVQHPPLLLPLFVQPWLFPGFREGTHTQ